MKYNIKLILCHLKIVETRYLDWPGKIMILGLEIYKASMLHNRGKKIVLMDFQNLWRFYIIKLNITSNSYHVI